MEDQEWEDQEWEEVQAEVDVKLAIFVYDDKLKKVVPISKAPVNIDDTRNYVNMRTTWSGTTKVEFSTTNLDESVKKMNGG